MRWRVNQLEKDKLEVTSRHNQEVRHRERFCPTESLKPQQHKALWVVCVCVSGVCVGDGADSPEVIGGARWSSEGGASVSASGKSERVNPGHRAEERQAVVDRYSHQTQTYTTFLFYHLNIKYISLSWAERYWNITKRADKAKQLAKEWRFTRTKDRKNCSGKFLNLPLDLCVFVVRESNTAAADCTGAAEGSGNHASVSGRGPACFAAGSGETRQTDPEPQLWKQTTTEDSAG